MNGLVAAITSFLGCSRESSGRYYMEPELGSRHRSEYARDRITGQWIYRVQAFNAQGTSAYSNQATIRVR